MRAFMKGRAGGLCLTAFALVASLSACQRGGVGGFDGQQAVVRVSVNAGALGGVGGATVVLKKDAQPVATPLTTDASGVVEFNGIPYGDGYRAFVNAHGFQSAVSDTIKVMGRSDVPVTLASLHAAGMGMVVGSVKEVQGAPVPGIPVVLAGRSAVTNSAGQYTFTNVVPGVHALTVSVTGMALHQAPPPVEVRTGDVTEVPTVFVQGGGMGAANLSAGRYLIATPGRVAEFDRTWQMPWRYNQVGLVTGVARLPSGETAIADASANRVIVVNQDGQVVFKYGGLLSRLKSPNWLAVDRTNGNILVTDKNGDQLIELAGKDVVWTSKGPWRQPSSATYTSRGTILVADTGNAAVAEVDRSGNVVWSSRGKHLKRPVHAQRLPNGNTLITDPGYNRVIEVDLKGQYVWHYDGYGNAQGGGFDPGYGGYDPGYGGDLGAFGVRNWDDAPISTPGDPGYQPDPAFEPEPPADPVPAGPPGALSSPRMAVRLNNGNTLIADTGKGRVLEVNQAGQIVWENANVGRAAVIEKIGDYL